MECNDSCTQRLICLQEPASKTGRKFLLFRHDDHIIDGIYDSVEEMIQDMEVSDDWFQRNPKWADTAFGYFEVLDGLCIPLKFWKDTIIGALRDMGYKAIDIDETYLKYRKDHEGPIKDKK